MHGVGKGGALSCAMTCGMNAVIRLPPSIISSQSSVVIGSPPWGTPAPAGSPGIPHLCIRDTPFNRLQARESERTSTTAGGHVPVAECVGIGATRVERGDTIRLRSLERARCDHAAAAPVHRVGKRRTVGGLSVHPRLSIDDTDHNQRACDDGDPPEPLYTSTDSQTAYRRDTRDAADSR